MRERNPYASITNSTPGWRSPSSGLVRYASATPSGARISRVELRIGTSGVVGLWALARPSGVRLPRAAPLRTALDVRERQQPSDSGALQHKGPPQIGFQQPHERVGQLVLLLHNDHLTERLHPHADPHCGPTRPRDGTEVAGRKQPDDR